MSKMPCVFLNDSTFDQAISAESRGLLHSIHYATPKNMVRFISIILGFWVDKSLLHIAVM